MNKVIIQIPAKCYDSYEGLHKTIFEPQSSDKILAIKAVKATLDCGLKTAKEIVEQALTMESPELMEIKIECSDDVLMALMKHLLEKRIDVRYFSVEKSQNFYSVEGRF